MGDLSPPNKTRYYVELDELWRKNTGASLRNRRGGYVEFAEVKRTIFAEVVRQGYTKAEDVPLDLLGDISQPRLQRWFDRFYASMKLEALSITPRLVNHFALGADPEFAFSDAAGGMLNACDFGLHAGLAYGMDNNSRLVELRPAPSKFALEVVASILSELRWMALMLPNTRQVQWICKPYFQRDGLGGHVHFGRKRQKEWRKQEVTALDALFLTLVKGGVFNQADVEMRRQRAQGALHGEHYGALSQIRAQKHGYEYRTMPTWLDNPWLAYLTLVLSKLVVHDPELIKDLTPGKVNPKKFIRNLLAYYKALDDDALIAYNALSVFGYPQQTGQDFRAAWGIQYPLTQAKPDVQLIPSSIEGTHADVFAVFEHLRTGKPIFPEVPEAVWTPTHLPKGYVPVLEYTHTVRRPGLGEMVWDLAISDKMPVVFGVVDSPNTILFQTPIAYPKELLPSAQKITEVLGFEAQRQLGRSEDKGLSVRLGEDLRDYEAGPKIKKLLLSGFLPVWKVGEVKPESFEEWQRKIAPKPEAHSGPALAKREKFGKEITQEVTF